MKIGTLSRHVIAGAGALALAACGGGGSGGVNFVPAPPSPPPAPPPPPPPPPPQQAPFDPFPNVKTDTDFAVVGLEANNRSPAELSGSGFSVRYDAASGSYVMDLPSTAATKFELANSTPNDFWWTGALLDESGNWIAGVNVLKPSNPELQLTYTTLAGYDTSGMSQEPFGWFAFGTATPAGSVPVSGSATYHALVRGSSIDNSGAIQGNATLTFDFGAGVLSGFMNPHYLDYGGMGETHALGTYTFANTVYASGSTTFSAQLSHPDFAQHGWLNGQFTGPQAQELMGAWSAPFRDPVRSLDNQMFGVLVGSR